MLKVRRFSCQVKPAVMAAPDMTLRARSWAKYNGLIAPLADFSAFISDGWVSLVGHSVQVPIKILRDAAALDSFMLESVLPFSEKTDTAECVITLGMCMIPFSYPLYQMKLTCGLVVGGGVGGCQFSVASGGGAYDFGE